MYWTDSGTGKIQRANLDGTRVEDLVTGLVRDTSGSARRAAWTPSGPCSTHQAGKIVTGRGRRERHQTSALEAEVPADVYYVRVEDLRVRDGQLTRSRSMSRRCRGRPE